MLSIYGIPKAAVYMYDNVCNILWGSTVIAWFGRRDKYLKVPVVTSTQFYRSQRNKFAEASCLFHTIIHHTFCYVKSIVAISRYILFI